MIKQIGSVYNKVELVKDRMYVKINGEDYVIENEWVNITYQVTKKGDKIVRVKLATEAEIRAELKAQSMMEFDKEIQKVKEKVIDCTKSVINKIKGFINK